MSAGAVSVYRIRRGKLRLFTVVTPLQRLIAHEMRAVARCPAAISALLTKPLPRPPWALTGGVDSGRRKIAIGGLG
jgi:hypothetical protein